ncbi:hypothetical protein [Olsenella sp. Marseille-P4559]|uniref:hypothetical protein n=1 Tax=Olsenella sp. Marseille-P4559 TaxID=2364795 RepID=UPI001030B57F|nr:hypothetical protein [Olsenella sp. Marseille-P4559]
MQKRLIVAGATLDRAISAMHTGDLLYERCRITTLPPNSCVNTREEFDKTSLINLRWLLDPAENEPVELFVSSPSDRNNSGATKTYLLPQQLPMGSLVRLRDNIFTLSPECYFVWKCRQIPDLPSRLMLCDELLGTYARKIPGERGSGCAYFLEPLTTARRLHAFLRRAGGMRGVRPARDTLRWALGNSFSPMESILATVIILPQRYGGWGYPQPTLNPTLVVPADKRHLTHGDSYMPDIAWAEFLLDVEYDSRERHDTLAERRKDEIRKSDIEALGYKVIPVHPNDLTDFAEAERLRLKIGEHLVGHKGRTMRQHLKRLDTPELAEGRRSLLEMLLHG